MKFPIVIKAGSERYHLTCELVSRDKDYEIFKLFPNNKPEKHIILHSNRPMLRAKGLKHKRINWKVSGDVRYPANVEQALRLIEKHLEPPEYNITIQGPEAAKTDTPNRKKKGPPGPTLGERKS